MTIETDAAVIGAGAAGVAAARVLKAAGADVLLLEARSRAGGRAFTYVAEGYPLDLGGEWLHSADVNPLVKILEDHGRPIDRARPPWAQANPNSLQPDQWAWRGALDDLEEKIAVQAATGVDVAVSTLMDAGGPWNARLDAFSSVYNGAPFRDISAIDFHAYVDTGVNYRSPEGYGAAIAALAPADILRLGVAVSRIDHSGPTMRLTTSQGEIEARCVIVCVSSNLIAQEHIVFSPGLPDKVAAAGNLPLGLADKLYLHMDEPDAFPENGQIFGTRTRADAGGYMLRPFGRPLIECFLGGDVAWMLEGEGPHAITAFCLEQLAAVFGRDLVKTLRPIAAHAWGRDPFALGSYSYAKPGHHADRDIIVAPVEDRLFFAGEHCSPDFFSTVHGAWITGEQAGRAAVQALRLQT
jgi:monoamine oxidase